MKRRCLFLHIDYPDIEREKEIVRVRVPEVDAALAEQIAKVVNSIRNIDLKKSPSISETIDWARTLVFLGRNEITPEVLGDTLHVLLKYQSDIAKARKELGVDATGGHQEMTILPAEPHMLDVLQGFVHELRTAGLPVSMTENLDAMRAIEFVPLDDRTAFKAALGATLVKNAGHYRVFDTVFEVFFSMFSPGVNADGESDLDADVAGELRGAARRHGSGRRDEPGVERGARADAPRRADAHGPERDADARRRRRSRASPAWSRAGRSAARTTSTARCGSSTPTVSSPR